MIPLDILILALPADRARAEMVLDGLHAAKVAGIHPTRIETPDPRSPDWVPVAQLARASRCVLCCWSHDTAGPEGAALRALGADLLARGTILSIELDRGATPPEVAGSTVYPAFGWRCRPNAILRFLFGDTHRAQIAVAAQRKVSGQDPPPPAALWQLVRGRAWVALVGFFALLGTASTLWGLWNDDAIERALDPQVAAEFARARDARDCRAMHVFSDKHSGSAWKSSVTEFLANCQIRDVSVDRTISKKLPLSSTSRADAEAQGSALCTTLADNLSGKSRRSTLVSFDANGTSWVQCDVAYKETEPREIYVR